MTCVTCHEATASHSSPRLAAADKHVGIRGGDAAALCLQCHQGASTGTVSIHAASYGRAHPNSKNPTAAAAIGDGVDAESRSCMACHDGAAASEAGSHAVRLQPADPLSDHPIGVSMRAPATARGADFKIANPVAIDHRIRLTDGKVACGSCHNMYSQERAKLVMSNQGSALCLSCHRQ
jgi:predicted CXXCH cytochrome family protein